MILIQTHEEKDKILIQAHSLSLAKQVCKPNGEVEEYEDKAENQKEST